MTFRFPKVKFVNFSEDSDGAEARFNVIGKFKLIFKLLRSVQPLYSTQTNNNQTQNGYDSLNALINNEEKALENGTNLIIFY